MPADEPTLGEVARTLERFERATTARFADLATSISLMVTRDLYEAHRTAMLEDLTQIREEIRTDRDKRGSDRRMVVGALLSAGLAIVVAIVTTLLKL